MIVRALAFLCVLTLVVPAWGQETAPPPGGNYPYVGEVIGTRVNVRSRPYFNVEYRCTQLSKPARVTVIGKEKNWLKILPPPGCFSAISRHYVTPDKTGKIGTITGDNVRVWAGGTLRSTNFATIQTRHNIGDKVQITGQTGDYYKIVASKGGHYWIIAKYVKYVGPVAPLSPPTRVRDVKLIPEPTPKPTPKPTAKPTTSVKPTPATAPSVVTKIVPEETAEEFKAALAKFRAAQKTLDEEYRKPFAKRDLKMVLRKFEQIKLKQDSYLKPYVDAQIRGLRGAIKRAEEVREIEGILINIADRQKQLELERARLQVRAKEQTAPSAYVAQGILIRSVIFRGSAATPRRFVLRGPDGRIHSYVRCTTGSVDLDKYVAKLVGIVGTKTYDKDLEINLIEARGVVVLAETATLPPAPEPIVKPLPKPPPQPASAPAKPAEEPTAKEPVPEPEPAKPEPATRPAEAKAPEESLKPVAKPPAPEKVEKPPVKPSAPPGEPTTKPAAPKKPKPDKKAGSDKNPPPKEPSTQPAKKKELPGKTPAPQEKPEPPTKDKGEKEPLPPTGLEMVPPTTTAPTETVNEDDYK